MDMWMQVDPDGKTRVYGKWFAKDFPRVQATFENIDVARRLFPKLRAELCISGS